MTEEGGLCRRWEGKSPLITTFIGGATHGKKVTGYIKLQIPAAKATPAPPVGPALGQHGVNIMGFCKEFNEKTASQAGLIIPVVITVYQDRSYTFITKTPPAAVLLKKQLVSNPVPVCLTKQKLQKFPRQK